MAFWLNFEWKKWFFWSSVGLTVPFLVIFCKRPALRNKFNNFWSFLGSSTYLMTDISPEIKKSPETPKNCPQTCYISKKWPNKPSKLSRIGQNCKIFKIWLLFGSFFGNTRCFRTNISPEIKRLNPQTTKKFPWTCYISIKKAYEPSEKSRTGHNSTIFKIWLLFEPLLGNKTC